MAELKSNIFNAEAFNQLAEEYNRGIKSYTEMISNNLKPLVNEFYKCYFETLILECIKAHYNNEENKEIVRNEITNPILEMISTMQTITSSLMSMYRARPEVNTPIKVYNDLCKLQTNYTCSSERELFRAIVSDAKNGLTKDEIVHKYRNGEYKQYENSRHVDRLVDEDADNEATDEDSADESDSIIKMIDMNHRYWRFLDLWIQLYDAISKVDNHEFTQLSLVRVTISFREDNMHIYINMEQDIEMGTPEIVCSILKPSFVTDKTCIAYDVTYESVLHENILPIFKKYMIIERD
jgi:hypothetical protein